MKFEPKLRKKFTLPFIDVDPPVMNCFSCTHSAKYWWENCRSKM